MSPDLTRNDVGKQGRSGGPIAKDVTGVEVYDTIFALALSPHEKGVIWAGSDDGLVHLTRDDGKTWQSVTPSGFPDWVQVNSIEVSPHDKASAYVAATMYKLDDFRPYLYKTADYGKTWTRIVNGIPETTFTRVVREDPARRGLLYAGTETGLYVSFDDGASWQPFQRNLPAVPITDLQVKDTDLVVATQGRAFWILDDLTPLRLWDEKIARSDVFLFPPRPAPRLLTEKVDEDDLNYEPKLDHDWVNLAGYVASADRRPTAGAVRYYALLKGRLDAIRVRWNALLEVQVAAFVAEADALQLPRVAPAPKIEK